MLVAAVLASVWVVRPFLVELGAGLVFGYVAERPVDWLLRKLKKQGNARWRAALSVALVVGALLLLIVPAVMALWIALRDLANLLNDATPGQLGSLGRRTVEWAQARGPAAGTPCKVAGGPAGRHDPVGTWLGSAPVLTTPEDASPRTEGRLRRISR